MIDIATLVRQNREEAYELIKKAGSRIDFVESIIKNDPDDDSQDDWNGDPNDASLPWVILAFDEELVDTAVLAVKCGEEKGCIEFLGYDVAEWTCLGWSSYAECCNNTDNDIYIFVDEWLKNHTEK